MGIFKFLKEAYQEGVAEGKQELMNELKLYEEIKNNNNIMEKSAIALACPFREIHVSSALANKSPHLFKTGVLTDKNIKAVKKILLRDFDIYDTQTLSINSQKFDETLNLMDENCDEYAPVIVAVSSIKLHIFTASIDVGFTTWSESKVEITSCIKNILQIEDITSWQKYADYFLLGEKVLGLNNSLGRKLIKTSINGLLSNDDSPWLNLNWNELTAIE
ncbi:hypothetical protein RHO13_09750 [Orbus wheelerorum]|uniref:hypothetical protein n=1 Tax=Orbus wheelerorum TaxID=3074111 RepID=UPI00370D4A61